MGCVPREKPARLAEKLIQVRVTLGFSQEEMVRRLGLEKQLRNCLKRSWEGFSAML